MPETNVTLLINYTLIQNKKFKKKVRGELPKLPIQTPSILCRSAQSLSSL